MASRGADWYGRNPDGSQSTSAGLVVRGVTLRRGVDTSIGQAGLCDACGLWMPDGPDICLGILPGVSAACCGHGGVSEPYVVIGGEPDEPVYDRTVDTRRGQDALDYFATHRTSP